MSLEIYPTIFGKKIGTLLYQEGRIYFEYAEAFKASNLEISPFKLPLNSTKLYSNTDDTSYYQGLPGVFHDSLPDKFGTKIIEKYFESKHIPPHELNMLQKLMFVGNKSMGAISYHPSEKLIDKHSFDELIDIVAFSNNAQKIIRGESLEVVEGVLAFMDSAASAGGARAKAVVGFDSASKKMVYGLRDELPQDFEHWLLKFDDYDDSGRSQDYTKLEYLYMTMAKEVGIDVPDIELLEQGDLTHYMIKRFDRMNGERLHLHSLAGLTHSNINIPGHYSYDNLLRVTRRLTGAQNQVEEMYKRMVFNIVARNQDDHAKNFSFLMYK
jgi:serine/threonine-protein kinase HipA